ncbi:MAG: hypothetical protein WA816_01505 [Bacteroidales bacterium]
MEDAKIEKLTKEWMAESKLELTNPIVENIIMNQILLEAGKKRSRKNLLISFLIFTGIELIIFALLLILLLYFPGIDYFTSAIKNSMVLFQKIGKLAIEYDYLILSFIVVGLLDRIMDGKVTASLKL